VSPDITARTAFGAPKKGGPRAKKVWTNYDINPFLSMLFLNPTQKILQEGREKERKKKTKKKEQRNTNNY